MGSIGIYRKNKTRGSHSGLWASSSYPYARFTTWIIVLYLDLSTASSSFRSLGFFVPTPGTSRSRAEFAALSLSLLWTRSSVVTSERLTPFSSPSPPTSLHSSPPHISPPGYTIIVLQPRPHHQLPLPQVHFLLHMCLPCSSSAAPNLFSS